MDCGCNTVSERATTLVEAARREVEASTRIVVGLGPRATLGRGFAIARDARDRPITGREAAMGEAEFTIEIRDGTVPVAVRESDGGSVR